MQAAQTRYGTTSDGKVVTLFTLENSHGMRVTVIDLGVTVTSVMVPDRSGKTANVSLGHETLAGWEKNATFFGCIVGRVANRIRGGRFDLDGKQYTLARNVGENHLHGGLKGFDKYVWPARLFKKGDTAGIRFQHTSPRGQVQLFSPVGIRSPYGKVEGTWIALRGAWGIRPLRGSSRFPAV